MTDDRKFDIKNFELKYHFEGNVDRWKKAAEEIATYESYLRAVPLDQLRVLANEDLAFEDPNRVYVDFEVWLAKEHWDLEQAIVLSLGQNPEHLVWHSVQEFPDRSTEAMLFRRRRELVLRAVAAGELWDPVAPYYFAAWVRRIKLVVPPDLRDFLAANFAEPFYAPLAGILAARAARSEASADKDEIISQLRRELTVLRERIRGGIEKSAGAEGALKAREKGTLFKLIFGMAVQKYHYDSMAARSEAVRRIANDLDEASVGLDDETIRDWLRAAAAYVLARKKKGKPS